MESNKIIAEFMGWKHHADPEYDKHEMASLKYHTSWDWLMPVVEFIDSIGFTTRIESSTDIIGPHYYGCWIWQDPEDNPVAATAHINKRIDAVYLCVIDFINWYNQHTTN